MTATMVYVARYRDREGYGAATADMPDRRKLVERRRAQWARQGAEVVRVTAEEASEGLRAWDEAEKEKAGC